MAILKDRANDSHGFRSQGQHWLQAFWQNNMRILLAIFTIAVSVLIGIIAPRAISSKLYLAAIVGIAIVPAALVFLQFVVQKREWAPIIILVACAFIPFSIPVRGSRFVLSMVLSGIFIALWLLKMIVEDHRITLVSSRYNLPLIGFILTVLVSLGWSNVFRDFQVYTWSSFPFAQISASMVMVLLPGLFLMVENYIHDLKWVKITIGIMFAAAVFGIFQQLSLPIIPVQIRGTFTMWSINLSVAFAIFNRNLKPYLRFLLVVLAVMWAYWAFGLTITWLASWLPSLVALIMLFFMRSRKLFFTFLLVLLVLIATNMSWINSVIARENAESGQTRLAAWSLNWRITQEHLLFGTGPAGYAVYYMTYFPEDAMATHSNYIDILSQLGIIGFIFYVWFFAQITWSAYRLSVRLRGRGDITEALANALLAGAAACIVANGVGDWLIPFVYTQGIAGYDYAAYNWLLLGFVPVLERITRPSE